MADKKFEILGRETLFQGYFRLDRYHLQHDRFDGTPSGPFTREVFERAKQVAGVLLYEPQRDKIVLVEQFRAGPLSLGEPPWTIEIVLGMVEGNETPEQAVRREALEEANCTVVELHPVARYYSSPGGTSEKIVLFIGRTTAPEDGIVCGLPEENENIRVHVMDAAKAIGLIYANKIRDAQTMVAMQWFAMHHTELRSRWLVSDASTPII